MERTDFNNWSQEDIKRQLDWLYSVPRFTVFTLNKAICFGDGKVGIAEFKEDKTWSSWETYDAPNLHVTEGKFVFNFDGSLMPIIRISTDEAIEICSTEADPWTDNDIVNILNDGKGSLYVESIAKGKLHRIELLTTRSTRPGIPFQTDISSKIVWMHHTWFNSKEERIEKSDAPYQSDEWVKYYPYKEGCEFWVPAQEIVYLKSLLRKFEINEAAKAPKKQPEEIVEKKEKEESNSKKSGKSYVIAAMLAIFLGSFGAHKFYMGKTLIGLLYLVFYWTWIPGIIGVAEGLFIYLGGQEKFESNLK